MLSDLLHYGLTPDTVFRFISSLFVVFCILPIHEAAHAFVAYKLGDNTAKYSGRLTLDPLKHLDPFGSVLILLFGFGWAKPVPINPYNFKNPKRGMAISALAGPVSNLLVAIVLMLFANGIAAFTYSENVIYYMQVLFKFFYYASVVSVSLAVFNLIPVPPLDGSRLLSALLPDRQYYKLMQYERYFMLIIIVLIATNVLDIPMNFLVGWLMNAIDFITRLPFSFI